MPSSNQVGEVLARVEGAERGSYALNADIYEFLGYEVKRQSETVQRGWRTVRTISWRYFDGRSWLAMSDLSGRIDDALRFTAEKLPNCDWYRRRDEDGPLVELWWRASDRDDWECAFAPETSTTPLAILAALLRALSSQETDRGNG